MTTCAAGGAGAAAAAAAIAAATKASGAIVKMKPEQFRRILDKADAPLVVTVRSKGLFSGKHKYLTSYKGLFFYTESSEALQLPSKAETVTAEKIWMP